MLPNVLWERIAECVCSVWLVEYTASGDQQGTQ